MRIHPVVSQGHRRQVPVDCTIAGHQVPAGVTTRSKCQLMSRLLCRHRYTRYITLNPILSHLNNSCLKGGWTRIIRHLSPSSLVRWGVLAKSWPYSAFKLTVASHIWKWDYFLLGSFGSLILNLWIEENCIIGLALCTMRLLYICGLRREISSLSTDFKCYIEWWFLWCPAQTLTFPHIWERQWWEIDSRVRM